MEKEQLFSSFGKPHEKLTTSLRVHPGRQQPENAWKVNSHYNTCQKAWWFAIRVTGNHARIQKRKGHCVPAVTRIQTGKSRTELGRRHRVGTTGVGGGLGAAEPRGGQDRCSVAVILAAQRKRGALLPHVTVQSWRSRWLSPPWLCFRWEKNVSTSTVAKVKFPLKVKS